MGPITSKWLNQTHIVCNKIVTQRIYLWQSMTSVDIATDYWEWETVRYRELPSLEGENSTVQRCADISAIAELLFLSTSEHMVKLYILSSA